MLNHQGQLIIDNLPMEGEKIHRRKSALIHMVKSQKYNFVPNQGHTVKVNLYKVFTICKTKQYTYFQEYIKSW